MKGRRKKGEEADEELPPEGMLMKGRGKDHRRPTTIKPIQPLSRCASNEANFKFRNSQFNISQETSQNYKRVKRLCQKTVLSLIKAQIFNNKKVAHGIGYWNIYIKTTKCYKWCYPQNLRPLHKHPHVRLSKEDSALQHSGDTKEWTHPTTNLQIVPSSHA